MWSVNYEMTSPGMVTSVTQILPGAMLVVRLVINNWICGPKLRSHWSRTSTNITSTRREESFQGNVHDCFLWATVQNIFNMLMTSINVHVAMYTHSALDKIDFFLFCIHLQCRETNILSPQNFPTSLAIPLISNPSHPTGNTCYINLLISITLSSIFI